MATLRSENRVLLTGAGFTHNFRTPLAEAIRNDILNHQDVQAEPRVQAALAATADYESVYQNILTASYRDGEKAAVVEAVKEAYSSLDETLRQYSLLDDMLRQSHLVASSVNLFGMQLRLFNRLLMAQQDRVFAFTINQDLFPERYHYREGGNYPVIPGVQSRSYWFTSKFRWPLTPGDYCVVPTEQELKANNQLIHPDANTVWVKLHGSQNWLRSTEEPQMVIAGAEETQIRAEPLLAWYADLFRDVLCQPNCSLLVIGYSFRDEHVNKVIAEAVTHHGLRVHVISPEPYDALEERLSRTPHGRAILPLSAYYCCTLVDMFPGDHRVTEAYEKLEKEFFGSGRP